MTSSSPQILVSIVFFNKYFQHLDFIKKLFWLRSDVITYTIAFTDSAAEDAP